MHELKTLPEYFQRVFFNEKKFEVRKNDRNFEKGDVLVLKEWDDKKQEYTGRRVTVRVTYILYGGKFGIEEGYCVMGFNEVNL